MRKKIKDCFNFLKEHIHKKHAIGMVFVLVLVFLFGNFMLEKESKAIRSSPEEKALTVKTITVKVTDKATTIEAYGTIEADRSLDLRSEVGGQVVEISDQFVKGGIIKKGETLIQIDPRDFQSIVDQEEGNVKKAILELKIEGGKQNVAKKEWVNLSGSIKKELLNEELVLREPHLQEKKASLDSAQSRLRKANIDLERTKIFSPFDAIIIDESAEIGSIISPQQIIAKLAATDKFRIQVSVPLYLLDSINYLDKKLNEDSGALVIQNLGKRKVVKKGTVLRFLGDLDEEGRMAKVLVSIDDPLGLNTQGQQDFPFLIGTYVKVQIQGKIVKNVIVIPFGALHENDTVWVMNENNQLEFKEVEVYRKTKDFILIREGLEGGEKVVVSDIALPIGGMLLYRS